MNIYLDKLELHGFKSFPEKTIIKFHKGLTAIIGPNGCGKSNIVDAVLWVLGEQKIKSLRGENNEDLIFNGSAEKKPLGMTEVGAHFIHNYDPVYIARRYYRSSETKYILNEKYCRNKDIQNALYNMQMGEKKYFIFEQGSIDKLVSLKAGEKRVLIEEAAGVSQYLERKKETVNKLIIAEQNLETLDMLIFDKEKRLKELKNQVNYVQRYRSYKIDKINNLKAFIQKKYNIIQIEVKKNIILKDEHVKSETVLLKDLTTNEKIILELEEERWAVDIKHKKLEKIKFESNSHLISTQKEIEKIKQQQEFASQQSIDLKKETDKNKKELNIIEPALKNAEKNLTELQSKIHLETEEQNKTKITISDLISDLDKYRIGDQNFKSEIFKVQSELSSEKNRLNKFERVKILNENDIKNKNKYLQEIISTDLKKKIELETKELAGLESDFSAIKKKMTGLEITQNNHFININSNKYKLNEMENEISSLKNQKEKYIEIKKKISGIASTENSSQSESPLQDILKTEKSNYRSIENYFFDEMDSIFLKNNNDISQNNSKYIIIRDNTNEIPDKIKTKIANEKGFIAFVSSIYELKDARHKNSLKEGIIVDSLSNGIELFLKYGYGVITENSEVITNNGIIIRDRDKGILNVNQEIIDAETNIKKITGSLTQIKIKQEKQRDAYKQITSIIEKEQAVIKVLEKDIFQKKSTLELLKNNESRNIKRIEIIKKEILIINKDNEDLVIEIKIVEEKESKLKLKEKELLRKNEEFKIKVEEKKDKINEIEKKHLKQQSSINLIQEQKNSLTSKISNFKAVEKRLESRNNENNSKLLNLSGLKKDADIKINNFKKELGELSIQAKNNENNLTIIEEKANIINRDIRDNTGKLNTLRIDISEIKEAKGEIEIVLSGYKRDVFQLEDIALKELNDEIRNIKGIEEYLSKDLNSLENEINDFDDKLNKMRDSEKLNFSAEAEYEILFNDQGSLITQKDDVIKSIEDLRNVIEKIDSQSKISFLKAFNEIKESFVKNFKILFEGGNATLNLTDQNNLLETGLDIKAQPPGKQLLSLRLLSGGEKTLTSLAFLFAMFQYKPAPFCIFDEVDASLDEANIQRFLKFLHILKKNTQFLIITHNFKTMEEADYLYGISMNKPGISTIYSTKFTDAKPLD